LKLILAVTTKLNLVEYS